MMNNELISQEQQLVQFKLSVGESSPRTVQVFTKKSDAEYIEA